MNKMQMESLVRLSIINSIFNMYEVGELSRNGQKLWKHTKSGMKKIGDRDIPTAIKLVESVDVIWRDTFTKFETLKFGAGHFITFIWTEELIKYGLSFKLIEKFGASEVIETLELEKTTDEIIKSFNAGIKGVVDEYQ